MLPASSQLNARRDGVHRSWRFLPCDWQKICHRQVRYASNQNTRHVGQQSSRYGQVPPFSSRPERRVVIAELQKWASLRRLTEIARHKGLCMPFLYLNYVGNLSIQLLRYDMKASKFYVRGQRLSTKKILLFRAYITGANHYTNSFCCDANLDNLNQRLALKVAGRSFTTSSFYDKLDQ